MLELKRFIVFLFREQPRCLGTVVGGQMAEGGAREAFTTQSRGLSVEVAGGGIGKGTRVAQGEEMQDPVD